MDRRSSAMAADNTQRKGRIALDRVIAHGMV
jgi:hypothetical protein